MHESQVGTKPLVLGYLQHQGEEVPPGFVVPAAYCRSFLEQVNWGLPLLTDFPHSSLRLDGDQAHQLRQVAQQLQQSLLAHPLPESWIAQLREFLQGLRQRQELRQGEGLGSPLPPPLTHVILRPCLVPWRRLPHLGSAHGSSSPSQQTDYPELEPWESAPRSDRWGVARHSLIAAQVSPADAVACGQHLKRLWADLFRAKHLLHWQRQGFCLESLALGVLVQPLAPAWASGTLTLWGETLYLECSWGLGFAQERGEVIPDRYRWQLQADDRLPQLGHKTVAYGYTGGPDSSPFNPQDPQWLNTAQAQQLVLSSGVLQGLGRSGLRVADLLRAEEPWLRGRFPRDCPLQLEWVWPQADQPVIWLQAKSWEERELPGGMDRWQGQEAHRPPSRVTQGSLDPSRRPAPVLAGQHFQGIGVAPGQVIGQVWRGDEPTPQGDLVLAVMRLTPHAMGLLDNCVGLLLGEGGLTSHGAIVARELGIPAVLGLGAAVNDLESGSWVQVDGDRGWIDWLRYPPAVASRIPAPPKPVSLPQSLPLWVSLSHLRGLRGLNWERITGLGLVRSEWLFLDLLEGQHPHRWIAQGRATDLMARMGDRLQMLLTPLEGRPWLYRSFDFHAQELKTLPGAGDLTVPAGTSAPFWVASPLHPAIFALELEVLHRITQGNPQAHHLRLLLPLVRTPEEIQFRQQQIQVLPWVSPLPLWMMAEVASVLLLLEDYAQGGIEGIVVGVHDLTYGLLALDRDASPELPDRALAPISHLDPSYPHPSYPHPSYPHPSHPHPSPVPYTAVSHPVVHRAILHLIRQCRQLQIPCLVATSELPRDPTWLEQWQQAGLTGLCLEPRHFVDPR